MFLELFHGHGVIVLCKKANHISVDKIEELSYLSLG
jgi:hypothetical protein